MLRPGKEELVWHDVGFQDPTINQFFSNILEKNNLKNCLKGSLR
jgi:hypothetical protein